MNHPIVDVLSEVFNFILAGAFITGGFWFLVEWILRG